MPTSTSTFYSFFRIVLYFPCNFFLVDLFVHLETSGMGVRNCCFCPCTARHCKQAIITTNQLESVYVSSTSVKSWPNLKCWFFVAFNVFVCVQTNIQTSSNHIVYPQLFSVFLLRSIIIAWIGGRRFSMPLRRGGVWPGLSELTWTTGILISKVQQKHYINFHCTTSPGKSSLDYFGRTARLSVWQNLIGINPMTNP